MPGGPSVAVVDPSPSTKRASPSPAPPPVPPPSTKACTPPVSASSSAPNGPYSARGSTSTRTSSSGSAPTRPGSPETPSPGPPAASTPPDENVPPCVRSVPSADREHCQYALAHICPLCHPPRGHLLPSGDLEVVKFFPLFSWLPSFFRIFHCLCPQHHFFSSTSFSPCSDRWTLTTSPTPSPSLP